MSRGEQTICVFTLATSALFCMLHATAVFAHQKDEKEKKIGEEAAKEDKSTTDASERTVGAAAPW